MGRPLVQRSLTAAFRYRSQCLVILFALWLTRTFWLPGRFMIGFDTFAYSGPNAEVTAQAVSSGRLPLINDFIFGGATHFGNPQAGVLYLPRLLPALMDTNRAMGLLVVAHVIVLGIGMQVFLRRMNISEQSSTVVAIIFMASGAVMTKTVQFEQILVIAWLPLLLASLHAVIESQNIDLNNQDQLKRWRSIGLLALVTAAVCSAGHPQLSYEAALTAIVFVIGLAIKNFLAYRSLRIVTAQLTKVTMGVLLGVLLVLPQMWAALVATQQSKLSEGRDVNSLGTADLALTVHSSARALFGTVRSINPAFFVGTFEPIAYIGVSMTLLATIGLVGALRRQTRHIPFLMLAAFGALCFLFSLGPRTIIFRAAFRLVPGFDFARVSARWLIILVFILCVLAAAGLDHIRSSLDRFSLIALGIAIALGSAYVIALTTLPDGLTTMSWVIIAAAIMVLTSLSLRSSWSPKINVVIAAIALAEVLTGSLSSIPQQSRSNISFASANSEMSKWLANQDGYTIALTPDFGPLPDVVLGLRPNANVLLGIRSIDGYDGGVQITDRWANSLRRFSDSPNTDLPLRNSLPIPIDPDVAARTGIHHVLVEKARFDSNGLPDWGSPVRSTAMFDVYRNPRWRGEALAWPAARMVSQSEINDLLRTQSDLLSDIALVESAPLRVADNCSSQCSVISLNAQRIHPERIQISGKLNSPSLVTFPMQTGPGWRATVDGEPAPLVPLDGLFLGVEVPAGEHSIIFEYRPGWIWPTFAISALALIIILWCLWTTRSVGAIFPRLASNKPARAARSR